MVSTCKLNCEEYPNCLARYKLSDLQTSDTMKINRAQATIQYKRKVQENMRDRAECIRIVIIDFCSPYLLFQEQFFPEV